MRACVLEKQNNFSEALDKYKEALRIFQKAFGCKTPPLQVSAGFEAPRTSLRQHDYDLIHSQKASNESEEQKECEQASTRIDGPLCSFALRAIAKIMFYEHNDVSFVFVKVDAFNQ